MESSGEKVRSKHSYFGQWYFAAVLAAILLTLPGLGEKRFFTRGEPREALVVDQMYRTGELILPRGYGGAIPSKPPLMHWTALVLSYPGGAVTELTARLPSALASILFIVYFFPFLARRTSVNRALIASVVLVSSFEWWRTATACRVDLLLSVLLALGLLELFRWREREMAGLPLGAILAFSGATLTKGPVSLVLPGMIFGLYLLISGISFFKAAGKTAAVMLLSCILPAFWYLAAYNQDPEAFSAKFYYENIARFLGQQEDDAHSHSAGYLLGTLGYGLLPWIAPVFAAGLISIFKFFTGRFTLPVSIRKVIAETNPIELFSSLAALLIILFFCIPSSKRSVYLLPAYPFIAVQISLLFESGGSLRSKRAEKWLAAILAGTVLLAALAVSAVIGVPAAAAVAGGFLSPEIRPIFTGGISASPVFGTLLILVVVGVVAAAVLIRSLNDRQIGFGALVLWVLSLSAANIVSTPFANQLGNDRFAGQIRPVILNEPDVKLYSYGQQFFGASFYLGRQIGYFDLSNPQPGLLLTSANDVETVEAELPRNFKFERLQESSFADTKAGLFPVLLRISPVSPP